MVVGDADHSASVEPAPALAVATAPLMVTNRSSCRARSFAGDGTSTATSIALWSKAAFERLERGIAEAFGARPGPAGELEAVSVETHWEIGQRNAHGSDAQMSHGGLRLRREGGSSARPPQTSIATRPSRPSLTYWPSSKVWTSWPLQFRSSASSLEELFQRFAALHHSILAVLGK